MDEVIDLNEVVNGEETEQAEFVLATITAVGADGVQIAVDGSGEGGEKEYKVNSMQKLAVGDRVKIHKDSGTYLIEYKIGKPMEDYPIPSGGSDGDVLLKDGATPYAVKWETVTGIPSGGTSGQVLVKNSNTAYDVSWKSAGIPSGGTTGQVLAKTSATDYAVTWQTIDTLPSTTGVTNGYVLTKTSSGIAWQAVPESTVSKLTNGSRTVTLSSGTSSALTPDSNAAVSLGTSSLRFNHLYVNGNMYLGASSATISFFGATARSRYRVRTTDSLATLIKGLQNYGLFSESSGSTPS